jgi:hypothetical protein
LKLAMGKDAWIQAHEELIEEFLDNHPGIGYDAAYDLTGHLVDDRLADHYAAQIDNARMMSKENG